MTNLVAGLERCRTELGRGQYPPCSTDDPDAVKQFLAKAFPDYHGDLPEKYKNLDPASSLVFWLGGTTDKDGNMIGFSANPKNPFDMSEPRIGPYFDFDRARLRNDATGLPVYLSWNEQFPERSLRLFSSRFQGRVPRGLEELSAVPRFSHGRLGKPEVLSTLLSRHGRQVWLWSAVSQWCGLRCPAARRHEQFHQRGNVGRRHAVVSTLECGGLPPHSKVAATRRAEFAARSRTKPRTAEKARPFA